MDKLYIIFVSILNRKTGENTKRAIVKSYANFSRALEEFEQMNPFNFDCEWGSKLELYAYKVDDVDICDCGVGYLIREKII